MRRGLVVRLVERLYVWATERDNAHFRRANPEWWARQRDWDRRGHDFVDPERRKA